MKKLLLAKLRHRKELYKRWKQCEGDLGEIERHCLNVQV